MHTMNEIEQVERRILAVAIRDILAAGNTLSVYDGAAFTVRQSRDPEAIMGALFTTDEDQLHIRNADSRYLGFVSLVHGNDGWDVIADNSVSLEPLLVEANRLADKLAGGGV